MRRTIAFLVLMALIVLLPACTLMPAEDVLPEKPVIASYEKKTQKMETVMRGNLTLFAMVECRFIPVKKESLSFPVGGETIDQIYVSMGQLVEAGEIMAELSHNLLQQIADVEYQMQLQEVKKRHLQEERDLEKQRYDILLSQLEQDLANADEQVIPVLNLQKQQQEENLRSKMEDYASRIQEVEDAIYIYTLRLNSMREDLKTHQLVAGIDGTVTYARYVQKGTRSTKDQVLIEISDLSSMAFTVSGENAQYFPIGTEVVVTCQGKEFPACSVDPAEMGIEPEEGQQIACLKLEQSDTILHEGDLGRIQVVLEERKNVLYLNKRVVKTSDGEPFVYMLDENGLRYMQKISTGMEANGLIEILDGLREGDQVLVD